jgi:hypothetical protein
MLQVEKEKEDYSLTTFNDVVVDKSVLLAKLKENRDNHQFVYDVACSGYWQQAVLVASGKKEEFEFALNNTVQHFIFSFNKNARAIEDKREDRMGPLTTSFTYNQTWPLKYPENHLDDYNRTIAMLELSVADKVKLTASQFESYVMNNWSWKKSFSDSNAAYASLVTGSLFNVSGYSPQDTSKISYLLEGTKAGYYK